MTTLVTPAIGEAAMSFETAVNFDIVMGFTPEDIPAGSLPVISSRSGVTQADGYRPAQVEESDFDLRISADDDDAALELGRYRQRRASDESR